MRQARIIGARAGQLMPWLLPKIDSFRKRGIPVLLLVPEQYTLQAEREMIEGLDLPGLMDVDVLSPRRLSQRIHERAGSSGLRALDDRGRAMALAQALSETAEELVYYRRVALSTGLPEKISVLLADMQRAGLTWKALLKHSDGLPPGSFKAKEHDLALIWREYDALISGRFADEAAQQLELLERLPFSGIAEGAAIFVYGFDVLPLPMCRLLTEAAKTCALLTVALVMDGKDAPDGRVFLTQRASASELLDCLKAGGIPTEWRYLPSRDDGRDPALRHVEKHLFTRGAVPFEGDDAALNVHAAANPYAEAAFAASTLHAWHEKGISWGRMAVTLAETANLPGILSVTLNSAGIPHYMARKDSAARHGLCRMLLGALECVSGSLSTADVLTMSKSGFSPLTAEEADELENYAIEQGIDRSKWLTPFSKGDAEKMEPLRLRLMSPVLALKGALRTAKTAGESVEALFAFLQEIGAYEKLMAREEELLRRNMLAEAAQNRQVWTLLMDMLDQLHALLGEKRANMKDLARFVASGLTGASISSLPPQPDTVMIGEIGHLMTGQIDALLVMGMQDGVMGSQMDSLLTETERRLLSDAMNRAVGLTRQETAALRQSDFYRTLALPRRHLTLTYSTGGQEGAALRPAGLMEDLKGLFPSLRVTGGVTASETAPLSPGMALDGLAARLRSVCEGAGELEENWTRALRWLWHDPAWHSRTEAVLASLSARNGRETLPPEQSLRLFSQDQVSISRLEKFAQCPYRHYVDYGLKPVKRRAYVFDPAEVGDFYHAAMQGYAASALAHPDFPDLPDAEVDRLMDQVVAPLVSQWESGPLNETPSLRLQAKRYVKTAHRAAWMFTRHAKNSRFTPVGAEVVFGEDDGLPPVILTCADGHKIALRGKIDRIDRWKGDEGIYLRVIDYKSSRREIDPTRLWYGLQLQLLLYLQAACQGMDGDPAGAFFFTVKDPLVEAEDAQEAAEKAIAKALRLEGVVLADVEVAEAMDIEPGYSMKKVFTAAGHVDARADAYTPEEMAALLKHVKARAAELADAIRSGNIEVCPATIGEWSACQWCEYAAICGVDPNLPGGGRELPVMSRMDLLNRLKGE